MAIHELSTDDWEGACSPTPYPLLHSVWNTLTEVGVGVCGTPSRRWVLVFTPPHQSHVALTAFYFFVHNDPILERSHVDITDLTPYMIRQLFVSVDKTPDKQMSPRSF